jgi:hypothetical protein
VRPSGSISDTSMLASAGILPILPSVAVTGKLHVPLAARRGSAWMPSVAM